MRRIQFKIAKNGDVKVIDACGYGSGCQQATQEIEKLLGAVDEKSRETTSSAFEKVDAIELHNEG